MRRGAAADGIAGITLNPDGHGRCVQLFQLISADSTISVDSRRVLADLAPMRQVIVVIADIVTSRSIPERNRFQTHLRGTLTRLSRRRTDLLSPYTVTLGDEFQCVLAEPGRLFEDIFRIRAALHPHEARFAVGIGELSTRLNRRMAIGMDGPAFHVARGVLEEMKASATLLGVRATDDRQPKWLEPTLDLVSLAVRGWRRSRLEIMARLLRGEDVARIAQGVELTPAAVYKNLRDGGLAEIRGALVLVADEMRRLCRS